MENLIIAIDQSTSATKAMLFNERCEMLRRVNVTHEQYYPKSGCIIRKSKCSRISKRKVHFTKRKV